MRGSERSLPSSPAPGATPEESLRFYKTQYELLEAELAEFQASSKDLEAELERDIEQAEKRERQLKEQASNLRYEVDEWKEKTKQAKSEANATQASLEREIKTLRQDNLTLRQRVRDIEVANDDYERKQRTTEVSMEDMESKCNQAIERAVMLEEEVKVGELERETLRIETQRLKDEFSDFKIETDILKTKLEKAEVELTRKRRPFSIASNPAAASPRSELSPTTTDASGPSFDTPAKAPTSSSASDTPTPPSPPTSEKSSATPHPFATPIPKSRLSLSGTNATPRQIPMSARANGHTRGASVAASNRTQAKSTYRQSLTKANLPVRPNGVPSSLPKSSSIVQLRNLRGKMQSLEERVQKARSKLPAPVDTPPRGSPRSGSALSNHVPASVTMRTRRKNPGSTLSGQDSQAEEAPSTPSMPRAKPSRQSLTSRPVSPTRTTMAAPPRPSSRASAVSHRTSMSQYQPGHSRPSSRASISGLRSLAGANTFAPNASIDRIRPHSSLSNHDQFDGACDEEPEKGNITSRSPRKSLYAKRTSDVGTAIPTPGALKRTSLGGGTRLPAPSRRQSGGIPTIEARPPSRQVLDGVQEGYQDDMHETF